MTRSKLTARLLGLAASAGLTSAGVAAVTAARSSFGTLADGRIVEAVTLTASSGIRARVINLGATLQALEVPGRSGERTDVVLGFDTAADYAAHPHFFGVTVGRYANRIAGGTFTLDGKSYAVPCNDKTNSLHGGDEGFDKKLWRIVAVRSGASASVTLALTSPAGDQGYPGTLDATATYTLDDRGALTIDYEARTDAPTIVNMTNHSYFNLAGEGARGGALGQRLMVPASRYTPVDATLIPTGALAPVAGTVFDFTRGRIVEEGVRNGRDPQIAIGQGYDHNFVLDAGLTAEPKLAARLEDPASGRVLEVWSNQPGVQVYSGNFLNGTDPAKHGHLYRMGDAIALEPGLFPNTPNVPAFGSARLAPGQVYHHRIVYRLSVVR